MKPSTNQNMFLVAAKSERTEKGPLATFAALVCALICCLAKGNVRTSTDVGLCRVAVVEGFLGDDSVDFWQAELVTACQPRLQPEEKQLEYLPVRMFWKASSTLLASSAEVSIKERLFSPGT